MDNMKSEVRFDLSFVVNVGSENEYAVAEAAQILREIKKNIMSGYENISTHSLCATHLNNRIINPVIMHNAQEIVFGSDTEIDDQSRISYKR